MKIIFNYLLCFAVLSGVLSCELKKAVQENVIDQEEFKHRVIKASLVLDNLKKMISETSVSKEVTYPQYYGGMYIDDAGNPVILTTDTTKKELIKKLARYDEVIVQPCTISYQYLKNVNDKIMSCLDNKPELIENVGINTFGILADKNCIDVSLVCCTPEKIELFKSLIVDDPCITFSENASRVVLQ